MRCVPLASLAFALTLTTLSTAAFAQDWSQPWADPEDRPPRVDVSVSTGFLMPTRWSDVALLGSFSPAQGALEQVLTRDVHVKPDTAFTAAATYWRNRYGFRAHAGFSRSSLQIVGAQVLGDPTSLPASGVGGETTSVGVDTWIYDIGAAIGFMDYVPTRSVWPYGFFGFGGITYDLTHTIPPPLTFVGRSPVAPSGANTIVIARDGSQFLLTTNALSTETVFALNFGLATDFRVPLRKGALALRLEVADHLAPSPLTFRVETLSPLGAPADTGVRSRLVHHLSATAGVVVQIGR